LAQVDGFLTAFEYDKGWLKDGFSISPFSLPLEQKVFIGKREPFDGVYGVFADSLPDGWGRLLVDRLMLEKRIEPRSVGSLSRLAIVGKSGMGALTYEPEVHLGKGIQDIDYDEIALECSKILKTDYSEKLDDLFALGGSSGGARPKILTSVDGEEWIVKFPSSEDGKNIGRQEYEYSVCAKKCGISMAETRLLSSKKCDGYFGTKRFDRVKIDEDVDQRIHMLTVSAILETSHRIPNLDYNTLMKLTLELTKEYEEIERLYRLMCFNVFAHNRDDHSKNFSFLYKEQESRWVLSPAYDLTFSYSIGGEHATTVHGNGKDPSRAELLEVAKGIGIREQKAKTINDEIYECVKAHLSEYIKL
jgi:serine/threonine-protein kinase HipA